MKRGSYLTPDLLCQFRTHHCWNTLCSLLRHLKYKRNFPLHLIYHQWKQKTIVYKRNYQNVPVTRGVFVLNIWGTGCYFLNSISIYQSNFPGKVIKMFYPLNSVVLLSSGVYPKEIHKDAYKNLCKMELFTNVHHRRGREDKKKVITIIPLIKTFLLKNREF